MAMTLRAAKLSDADLPRATADAAKWDKSGLKEACQRGLAIGRTRQEFDLQLLLDMLLEIERLEAAPRATGEIEACLAELREMFPGKVIMVRREDSFYPPDCRDAAETNSMVTIKIGYLESEPKFRSFRSFTDCMAQVRAATRTEG
jgi:hypothetical protein